MRVSGLLLKVLAYPCLLFKVLSEYDLFLFSFTSQAIPPGTEGGGNGSRAWRLLQQLWSKRGLAQAQNAGEPLEKSRPKGP